MINKIRYLLLLLLLILPMWLGAVTRPTYNVLYIHSGEPRKSWFSDPEKSLKAGFTSSNVRVNIVTEELNAELWTFASEKALMRRFCERARERKTDLIVTSGDEAFYSLLNCGDSLPLQIPVVYYGIKYPDDSLMEGLTNVCGYTTTPDFNLLLEQTLNIYPDMREVVCVLDDSFLSQKGYKEFEKGWQKYSENHPDCKLQTFNVQEDLTNKVIMSICNSRYSHGRVVIVPKWSDFFAFLGKNSKAPFFSTQSETLTNGVFCAYDADPNEIARLAGIRAGKVLQGDKPEHLGTSPVYLDFIYDYKQLSFFHVDKERVKGGVIMNIPYNEKYQWYFVLLYAFILALFIAIVGWLVRVNRRESRRRMHAQTRLLVQNRLVAQRDEFDNIFHSIRDGVITYDTDLRIHFTNRSLHRMLNLPENANRPYEGQQVGTLFKIFNAGQEILPQMLKQVLKKERRLVIPDNSFVQEINHGVYFPISGEVVPLYMNGKVSGVALSFRNVSDEEMNKRFFSLAVEESSIYPWQFNVRTGLFTFPASYARLFDLENTPITREIMESMVHPDELPEILRLFDSVLSGLNLRTRMMYRQRSANGKYEWWEYRISALNGMTDDLPYNILGVCQSIQRYKDTEEELTDARDKALQADKLKTAFLANMSHEIRTPLNAIVGFSDLLSDTSDFSQEEISNFIYTINRNCGLLLALINDILDLSRIESGTMDFQFTNHSIPLMLKEVYSSQLLNMPPNVKLVLSLPPDSKKYILTDNVRLQQVINNLINNAAKFTSSGSITFGYIEEKEGFTTLFVEDTGVGISQEGIDHIFERFYKVDNFTQGAGLGLSICMTIVERLKGTISVTSEEGKGTRFMVCLPDSCEF